MTTAIAFPRQNDAGSRACALHLALVIVQRSLLQSTNPMLSSRDSSVEFPSPRRQGLHHQIHGLVIREVVKQFPLKLSLPRVFQPCSKRQTKRQISPVNNGFSCHEFTVSHLTLGASTSKRGARCSTHAVILKKGKRRQIVIYPHCIPITKSR